MKKYFTISELCKSNSHPELAAKTLPLDVAENITQLCFHILQPLREAMGFPITITSGYRPAALNKAVGGVTNSWHLTGRAADIDCGTARNKKVFDWLNTHRNTLPIRELLWEGNGRWVHVAIK